MIKSWSFSRRLLRSPWSQKRQPVLMSYDSIEQVALAQCSPKKLGFISKAYFLLNWLRQCLWIFWQALTFIFQKECLSTANSPMLARYWRASLCWAGYRHTTQALFSVVAIEDAISKQIEEQCVFLPGVQVIGLVMTKRHVENWKKWTTISSHITNKFFLCDNIA